MLCNENHGQNSKLLHSVGASRMMIYSNNQQNYFNGF